MKIIIKEFIAKNGKSPFSNWFNHLDAQAAFKIVQAQYRLQDGNFSNVKSVGEGVFEYKINSGPGYRIYFGQDGDTLIILLGGGTKHRQQNDIKFAKQCWQEYKRAVRLEKQRWH